MVASQKLLELEAAIERRYLKAPLGRSNNNVTLEAINKDKDKEKDNSFINENGEEKQDETEQLKESDEVIETELNEVEREEQIMEEKDFNEDDDEDEEKKCHIEGISRGLQTWRDAVAGAKNAAQLAMALYQLETSIAWDKSIMKAFCQFCHGGDNENALLLCDGCDKGYHTYCFKPAMEIPEGDW